jgi:hypothetical protein
VRFVRKWLDLRTDFGTNIRHDETTSSHAGTASPVEHNAQPAGDSTEEGTWQTKKPTQIMDDAK